jgi:2-polyprenyl-6-methoxyphenol hydroxylase-like FAD-dependent oxidoreductase
MRVIIIGSGIAGLSAAIGLRKVGIEATIYERATELREVGAGISLWANALVALDHLGAGDAVRSRAVSLTRSEVRAQEGRKIQFAIAADQIERQIGVSPVMAMIHRADLVGALAELLPEGTARYGYECVGVEQIGDRAQVRFANGHIDEADAVVGADGIHSVVRATLFGSDPPRYAGYTCWRGVCHRPAATPAGYSGEWWGRGQRFGITTLPEDRVYWFAVRNAPGGQHAADPHALVTELFRGWADPVPEIIASTPPDQLVHNDIIDRPPMPTWSRGRIGLIGDAAHPTTPNLGQGGCMAIEDAVALPRALTKHADPAAAFDAFTNERRERTAAITHESWQLGKIAQWEGRLPCLLRDALLGLLMPVVGPKSLSKYAAFDIGPLATR